MEVFFLVFEIKILCDVILFIMERAHEKSTKPSYIYQDLNTILYTLKPKFQSKDFCLNKLSFSRSTAVLSVCFLGKLWLPFGCRLDPNQSISLENSSNLVHRRENLNHRLRVRSKTFSLKLLCLLKIPGHLIGIF